MTERNPDDVTLLTLHEDLTAGFAEMRAGFTDVKATLIAGFRGLPTRESYEEMVRLLRERNRQLDLHVREPHHESQPMLHALVQSRRRLAEGQRRLTEGRCQLSEAQRLLVDDQRSLSRDIKALIARIDALIKRRDNGEPAA